jgi:N-acetylglucosaminyl-diphospho-decaprenol L-rhamnosyltransferase
VPEANAAEPIPRRPVPAMDDLLISIAHFNTPALLRRCLASLAEEGSRLRKKIVVVDNASTPPLSERDIQEYPNVTLIANPRNVGFGAANNQVFHQWRAPAYLVLNPDVQVSRGSLSLLLDRLASHPRIGALGVRLRYPDGRPQSSCRRYPTLRSVILRGLLPEPWALRFPAIRHYLMNDLCLDQPGAVDWVLGSSLLLRQAAVEEVGGFDERFFMYYEDIDLCYRLSRAGWRVEHFPAVEWIHDYRRQSVQAGQWRLRARHFQSALAFLRKHFPERGWHGTF